MRNLAEIDQIESALFTGIKSCCSSCSIEATLSRLWFHIYSLCFIHCTNLVRNWIAGIVCQQLALLTLSHFALNQTGTINFASAIFKMIIIKAC